MIEYYYKYYLVVKLNNDYCGFYMINNAVIKFPTKFERIKYYHTIKGATATANKIKKSYNVANIFIIDRETEETVKTI